MNVMEAIINLLEELDCSLSGTLFRVPDKLQFSSNDKNNLCVAIIVFTNTHGTVVTNFQ